MRQARLSTGLTLLARRYQNTANPSEEAMVSLTLTYLGHSAFLLADQDENVVAIDPFLTGNPSASLAAEDVQCQSIVLTHGHPDHLGDTVAIAKRCGATVYGSWEISNYMNDHGVAKTEPANHGGKVRGPFGWVAFTPAIHSSSYDGVYLGMAAGAVVHMGGKTVWHCGDTTLFSDMKLWGEIYKPDAAMIPIGDRFTMGPELASTAAEWIAAPVAIPVHYNTWPLIEVDVSAFKPRGIDVRCMDPGETWEVE